MGLVSIKGTHPFEGGCGVGIECLDGDDRRVGRLLWDCSNVRPKGELWALIVHINQGDLKGGEGRQSGLHTVCLHLQMVAVHIQIS